MGNSRQSQHSDIAQRLHAIQAGKDTEEHFHEIFQTYLPGVVHYFVKRGFPRSEADDLAQDVLLRVYKSVDRFRFESSFDTWLFRIVVNVWKNALRSRSTLEGRAEKIQMDTATEQENTLRAGVFLSDPTKGPLDLMLADERHRLLSEALGQLPPKMRQCVVLRIGQGLKYREIAEFLGVTVGTVKTHLGTARRRLGPILEPHVDVFEF